MQEVVAKSIQSEPLLSLSFLRGRIPAEFKSQFVEDTRTCLDCGAKVVLQDDELACSKCGRVWSDEVAFEPEQIPFEESSVERGHAEGNYSPGSELAFGHGLGAGLDGRGLFRILAQGPNGPTDLPLRAMQVRLLTSKLEHPTTQTLLGYGSTLMKNYGLHTNKDSDVLFANTLGKQLRKIAGYFVIRGESGGEAKRVASALFYKLFVEKHPAEADRLFAELGMSPELLRYVENLLGFLTCPKPVKKAKKPKGQN